jgi:hypothetical protein
MAGKSDKPYRLEAVGGDRYPSLEATQAAATRPVAQALAIALLEMLASGELIVVDGKVVPPRTRQEDSNAS